MAIVALFLASSKLLLEGQHVEDVQEQNEGENKKVKNKQGGTFAHVFAPQVGVSYYNYYTLNNLVMLKYRNAMSVCEMSHQREAT